MSTTPETRYRPKEGMRAVQWTGPDAAYPNWAKVNIYHRTGEDGEDGEECHLVDTGVLVRLDSGDWIVDGTSGINLYCEEAFHSAFEPMPDNSPVARLIEAAWEAESFLAGFGDNSQTIEMRKRIAKAIAEAEAAL